MAEGMSMLAPAGPGAGAIAGLWWFLLSVCSIVMLVVCALLVRAALRPHDPDALEQLPGIPDRSTERRAATWALIGGAAVPAPILLLILTVSMRTMGALEAKETADVTIMVTGHQFWWDVVYLDDAGMPLVRTANEIRIPAGRTVELQLRAADVIHSFWVPRLHGKLDMIPGITNVLRIVANEPGVYRGACAEYCGVQHARMSLLVEVLEDSAYAAWLARERAPAAEPSPGTSAAAGRAVFLSRACVACHAIRGARADATLGPDLTHLAGRRTLLANTVPNRRGHLGGVIVDPQGLKPGVRMPAVPLPPDSLNALLDYLGSLR